MSLRPALTLLLLVASLLPAQAPRKAAPAEAPLAPVGKSKLKPVDINHATKNELQFMLKIDEALAAKIIANRPYKTKADLVTKNVMPLAQYQGLRKQVAAK